MATSLLAAIAPPARLAAPRRPAPTAPRRAPTPGLLVAIASLAASCGFPRPADVGPDDIPGPGECQLTAITPSIANTDDTITLEGTFADPVTVTFPGGTSVTATVLGPHRARTTVPQSATEGDLTVTACGSSLGAVPFRRASFALGLGRFESNFHQTSLAQHKVTLGTARTNHTNVVVGRYLYALGGTSRDGALNTVEQARINADGTLGPFVPIAGLQLATARQGHTAALIGGYLYVIGGIGGNNAATSVERASVAADGSLGPFATVPGVNLTTPRQDHASVVVGNFLYIIGGSGTNSLNALERAAITRDGTLGPFARVPEIGLTARQRHTATVVNDSLYVIGGSQGGAAQRDIERVRIEGDGSLSSVIATSSAGLSTARAGHTAQIAGKYLYIVGGATSATALSSIERARIEPDGSLGMFTAVAGVTLSTARQDHQTSIIGNFLYALGGIDSVVLDEVERGTLDLSSAVSSLSVTPDRRLAMARVDHTALVSGNHLYILGGTNGPGEQSSISMDGSLAQFSPVLATGLSIGTNHQFAIYGNFTYAVGLGGFRNLLFRAEISIDGTLGSFSMLPDTSLNVGRILFSTVILGDYIYAVGGIHLLDLGAREYLDHVERALLRPDGSVGPFEVPAGAKLTTPRALHAMAVIGNYLYVLGGDNDGSILASVERATIAADGSLGPFEIVPSAQLAVSRAGHAATVIGNSLCLLGGFDGAQHTNSIECATINVDGTLRPFEARNATLTLARERQSLAIIGNSLYVFGGLDRSGKLSIIERGTLGTGSAP